MRPMSRCVPALFLLALLAGPVLPASAGERTLLRHAGVEVRVAEGDWCAAQVTLRIHGRRSTFTDQALLDKLYGGIRSVLGMECAEARRLQLLGLVGGREVYAAQAAASDGWQLKPLDDSGAKPGMARLFGWVALGAASLALLAALWWWRRTRPARLAAGPLAQREPPVASPTPSPRPVALPAAAASQASPAAAPAPAPASGRQAVLQEQREKYQHSLNQVSDQLTELQIQHSQQQGLPAQLNQALQRLAEQTLQCLRKLFASRQTSWSRAFLGGLYLAPVWSGLRRSPPVIWLGLLAACLWWGWRERYGLVLAPRLESYAPLLLFYLLAMPLSVLLARRGQSAFFKHGLRQQANALQDWQLCWVYAGQRPGKYQALRIRQQAGKVALDELAVADGLLAGGAEHGALLLRIGEMLWLRQQTAGNWSLIQRQADNTWLEQFSPLLLEALKEVLPTVRELGSQWQAFAERQWRMRQLQAEIPRQEGLLQRVERIAALWQPVAIADAAFAALIRRIDLFNLGDNATPAGILLQGEAGNGKEFIARRIAQSVFAEFHMVEAGSLASAKDVRNFWNARVEANQSCVIYLAYAEQLFGQDERQAMLVQAWLDEWERHPAARSRIWVVMGVTRKELLHKRLLAAFGSAVVEIVAPDAAGRRLLLEQACRDNQLQGNLPPEVVDLSAGASVRELLNIVKEARLHALPGQPTLTHWRAAIQQVRGSDAQLRNERSTWQRLVLPAEVKARLRTAEKIVREAERYKANQFEVPNILLYGPPGTGKTEIARTLANESGVRFIVASTNDLKGRYVGETGPKVAELFARARSQAPCILFIDEIDAITARRDGEGGDSFVKDAVNAMLTEMDGVHQQRGDVVVLAATNHMENIDSAILSRFTEKIEIPLPDEAGRAQILAGLLADCRLAEDLHAESLARELSPLLKGKSGRDLLQLVRKAKNRSLREADDPEQARLSAEHLRGELAPQAAPVLDEAQLQQSWAQIVLKETTRDTLMTKIRLFSNGDKAAPRGLLLYGPPGTGKTEIARRIADSAGCRFLALSAPDLKGSHLGQTAQKVRELWQRARAAGRCVIFIDECEGVFARRGSLNSDSFSDELVQSFLAEWDGLQAAGQIWVVGATNRVDLLDEAILSRFGQGVEIGLPDAAQRQQILALELSKLGREASVPAFAGEATQGCAGRDLANLVRELCSLAAERQQAPDEALWSEVLQRQGKAQSDKVDSQAGWDSLILAEDTLERLQTLCGSLRNAELLRSQGVPLPRAALLYGPPGTGKTQVARTLANESGVAFISRSVADLKAGYVGQSAIKVREAFEQARSKAPCILFIDEIEALVPPRGSQAADAFTDDIVNQLLQELDGVKQQEAVVFVLAATNLPERIDAAILSRFMDKIELPLPTPAQRSQLLRLFLGRLRTAFDADEVAARLASQTDGLGGRDLRSLVERAVQRAAGRALRQGTAERVELQLDDLLAELPALSPASDPLMER